VLPVVIAKIQFRSRRCRSNRHGKQIHQASVKRVLLGGVVVILIRDRLRAVQAKRIGRVVAIGRIQVRSVAEVPGYPFTVGVSRRA